MEPKHYDLIVSHSTEDIFYHLFSDPGAAEAYRETQGYYEPIADTVLRYKQTHPGSFSWLDGMTREEIADLDQNEIFNPDHCFYTASDLVAFAVSSGAVIDKEQYYIIC